VKKYFFEIQKVKFSKVNKRLKNNSFFAGIPHFPAARWLAHPQIKKIPQLPEPLMLERLFLA